MLISFYFSVADLFMPCHLMCEQILKLIGFNVQSLFAHKIVQLLMNCHRNDILHKTMQITCNWMSDWPDINANLPSYQCHKDGIKYKKTKLVYMLYLYE